MTGGSWFGRYREWAAGASGEWLAGLMADAMGTLPGEVFPVAAEPILVPAASYRKLLGAAQRLLELQHTAVRKLAVDRAGRMTALRTDPAHFPRFTDDDDFELRHAADMARADVIVGADGPQFIEFNVGAGAGGMVHHELMRRIWHRVAAEASAPVPLSADAFGLFASYLRRTSIELGLGPAPSVVLVGALEDPWTSRAVYACQTRLLGEHGVAARFADLSEVLDQARPATDLAVVRFSEVEANALGWDLSGLLAAVKGGLRAVPSQSARLLDSKKVLALLSAGLPWMSDEDRELVRRFVPWSRVLGDYPVTWRGRTYRLPDLLVRRQERFVLKGAAGLGGQEVVFGATADAQQWQHLVETATESGYYVAQEVVTPVRHPVRILLDESGRTETVQANAVLGLFSIGGETTGCNVRFDTRTEPGLVSRSAGAIIGDLFGSSTVVG